MKKTIAGLPQTALDMHQSLTYARQAMRCGELLGQASRHDAAHAAMATTRLSEAHKRNVRKHGREELSDGL